MRQARKQRHFKKMCRFNKKCFIGFNQPYYQGYYSATTELGLPNNSTSASLELADIGLLPMWMGLKLQKPSRQRGISRQTKLCTEETGSHHLSICFSPYTYSSSLSWSLEDPAAAQGERAALSSAVTWASSMSAHAPCQLAKLPTLLDTALRTIKQDNQYTVTTCFWEKKVTTCFWKKKVRIMWSCFIVPSTEIAWFTL